MSTVKPSIEDPTPPLARRVGATWAWVVIACVLLGTSGVVRGMQERRHQFERSYKAECPIELKKLPNHFGKEWSALPEGEKNLDELTMRITGGTDHVIKTYANNLTGVSLTVLVLYGPAEPVLPHTPQICYPSSGFEVGDIPTVRTIEYSLGENEKGEPIKGNAAFLSASYAKPNGRQTLREGVYHSFRLDLKDGKDGKWNPLIGVDQKFPRRNPGLFKVQIQRMIADGESLADGDPIEQFLKSFLTEIEAEIRAAETKDTTPAAKDAAPGVAAK
jgi:Protein of unknown function (DUF3485)